MTDKPNVTDADREAAEQWRWSLYSSEEIDPTAQVEVDLAELTKDFAAHRIAAERETEARIVAWLRVPRNGMGYVGRCLADAIEQGEYRNG